MSFFFKRNKDVAPVEPAEDVAEPVAEPQPAPEPEEPDVTAPKRTSEMVKTREGLIKMPTIRGIRSLPAASWKLINGMKNGPLAVSI